MVRETRQQSFYEILDISMSAKPEMIRTAYIRAKNTYARDSLAVYTLFEPEESRRILEQIEEAYNVLSDPERRRKYDDAHGFMSFDNNAALAAMEARDQRPAQPFTTPSDDRFNFEEASDSSEPETAAPAPLSPIERLQASSSTPLSPASFTTVRPYKVQREYTQNPEMEERIKTQEPVTGPFLKEIREYRRASPEEIMDITKINRNYLNALENDDFSKLPASVYVRGFIAQYAKALGLESRIADSYMAYLKSKRPS